MYVCRYIHLSNEVCTPNVRRTPVNVIHDIHSWLYIHLSFMHCCMASFYSTIQAFTNVHATNLHALQLATGGGLVFICTTTAVSPPNVKLLCTAMYLRTYIGTYHLCIITVICTVYGCILHTLCNVHPGLVFHAKLSSAWQTHRVVRKQVDFLWVTRGKVFAIM